MADPTKKPFCLRADQLRPIATGHGGCIATDMITCGGRKVAFMYREATERELDSGWRFMSGLESDDYINDPDNHAVYDVNTIGITTPTSSHSSMRLIARRSSARMERGHSSKCTTSNRLRINGSQQCAFSCTRGGSLLQREVKVDGPDWMAAVLLKQGRAYRQLEHDGLSPQFIRAHYDSFAKTKGRLLHDHKLREEASRCRVIGWFVDEQLVAYASVQVAQLLGSRAAPILNVVDLCLSERITSEQCPQLVGALNRLAADHSAVAFEVTTIGTNASLFWTQCELANGDCVARTYRFQCRPIPEEAPPDANAPDRAGQ